MVDPAKHDVVVIGASAGGVEALVALVRELPPDLPAAIGVVLHVSPTGTSVLADILNRSGPLRAVSPADGAALETGTIYVAPPDRHLLFHRGRVEISHGPRESGHRPALDPLFRSAAEAYGRRVTAVVLSGSRDDGTAGLQAVKAAGGTSVVQDPSDALYPSMPTSALAHVEVDWSLPGHEIGPLIAELAGRERHGEVFAIPDDPPVPPDPQENEAAGLTCPECGGAMWQIHEGRLVRFKCRVGHAYSLQSMLEEQSETLEAAMWTAQRSLEDRRDLLRRMAERLRSEDRSSSTAEHFDEQAEEAAARAELIERAVMDPSSQPR